MRFTCCTFAFHSFHFLPKLTFSLYCSPFVSTFMHCDALQLATQWLHRQHCVGHLGNVSLVARHRNGTVSCFFFTTFCSYRDESIASLLLFFTSIFHLFCIIITWSLSLSVYNIVFHRYTRIALVTFWTSVAFSLIVALLTRLLLKLLLGWHSPMYMPAKDMGALVKVI